MSNREQAIKALKFYNIMIRAVYCSVFFTSFIWLPWFVEVPYTSQLIYFFVLCGALLLGMSFSVLRYRIYRFNAIDVALCAWFCFLVARYLWSSQLTPMTDQVLIWGLLIGFYFTTKHFAINLLTSIWFRVIIMIVVGGHCLFGILEYTKLIPFFTGNFPMGNLLGNPGPYAIYLASFVPLLLFYIMDAEGRRLVKITWCLLLIATLIILFLSESRTAMLSLIVSAIYGSLTIKKPVPSLSGTRFKSTILIVLILSLVVCLPIMYSVKKPSADGRVLIWKISSQAVAEAPLLGHGMSAFLPVYGNHQSGYFQDNLGTENEKSLAGINAYAFNEYLQLLVEYGLIGLLLFIGPIWYLLKRNSRDPKYNLCVWALKCGVTVIMVASMFSYPLRALPIQVNLFFFLGVLSSITANKTINLKGHYGYPATLILVFSSVLYFTAQRLIVELKWKKATELAQHNQFYLAESIYTELLPYKRNDPNFTFNMGAELSVAQQYSRSIPLLEKASEWLSIPDVYNYLGNSYEANGNLPKAIASFQQAHFRQPALLYPLYRLVWLYDGSGMQPEAIRLAKKIVDSSPKIVNETTMRIQAEMADFIQEKN